MREMYWASVVNVELDVGDDEDARRRDGGLAGGRSDEGVEGERLDAEERGGERGVRRQEHDRCDAGEWILGPARPLFISFTSFGYRRVGPSNDSSVTVTHRHGKRWR